MLRKRLQASLMQCSGCKRRRFFHTSSLPLIKILQNHFFQLHSCNNHFVMKFRMDSQVNLNMTKASNFAENRRNRKNHTKSYDRILEATPIQVSSDADVNALLSRNNYIRFGITYPTGRFYKGNNSVKSVQIRSYFWSVFFCIRTDCGDYLSKSQYSVRILENTDKL